MTLRDPSDVAALDAAVDPDGSLAVIFDRHYLTAHDWVLSVLLEVTPKELSDLVTGRRRRFAFTIPSDLEGVRGSGVFCVRCQVSWAQMTETEREGCRGGDGE